MSLSPGTSERQIHSIRYFKSDLEGWPVLVWMKMDSTLISSTVKLCTLNVSQMKQNLGKTSNTPQWQMSLKSQVCQIKDIVVKNNPTSHLQVLVNICELEP